MRIIGGKDYYDGVQYDTDESRIFIRHDHNKTDPIKAPELQGLYRRLLVRNGLYGRRVPDNFFCLNIIFCGKLYNTVLYSKSMGGWGFDQKMCWNTHSLLNKMHEDNLSMVKNRSSLWSGDGKRDLTEADLDEFFRIRELPGEMVNYLIDNKIIVAIHKSVIDRFTYSSDDVGNWFINTDGLKNYGFGSVLDPWTANQEIDMFLGTILVRDEDRRVELSDKSKLKKHGFDQWTFRKQSHQGKPRRGNKAV